jgi:pSer/pThr/pTyr-binding forkhead associated (FHA) protein
MTAIALQISESKWTMMSGPTKGAVLVLSHPVVILGRSSECDIVILNDPKCSRKHAKVEWTQNGFEISALSSNNVLKINGEATQGALLKEGDIVCCGETEIQFQQLEMTKSKSRPEPSLRVVTTHPSSIARSQPQAQPPQPMGPPTSMSQTQTQFQMPPPSKPRKPKSNNTRFYIYAFAALLMAWVLSGGAIPKKKTSLRSEEQIKNDIEAAEKLQQQAEMARPNGGTARFEVQQAQENFVKGFRDFRKGQYERALESFRSCLALYPDHVLCNRYARLAEKKFGELIQYQMVLGRKYREQNQYRACQSAFRNVMVMIKDQSSTTYREAKANFDACNALTEGHF